MWIVLKYKKNEFNFLKQDFKNWWSFYEEFKVQTTTIESIFSENLIKYGLDRFEGKSKNDVKNGNSRQKKTARVFNFTYRDYKKTIQCLKTILLLKYKFYNIVLVDNSENKYCRWVAFPA